MSKYRITVEELEKRTMNQSVWQLLAIYEADSFQFEQTRERRVLHLDNNDAEDPAANPRAHWEPVCVDALNAVQRLEVPGGWIYKVNGQPIFVDRPRVEVVEGAREEAQPAVREGVGAWVPGRAVVAPPWNPQQRQPISLADLPKDPGFDKRVRDGLASMEQKMEQKWPSGPIVPTAEVAKFREHLAKADPYAEPTRLDPQSVPAGACPIPDTQLYWPFDVYEDYDHVLHIIDATTRVVLTDCYAYDGPRKDVHVRRMNALMRALNRQLGPVVVVEARAVELAARDKTIADLIAELDSARLDLTAEKNQHAHVVSWWEATKRRVVEKDAEIVRLANDVEEKAAVIRRNNDIIDELSAQVIALQKKLDALGVPS